MLTIVKNKEPLLFYGGVMALYVLALMGNSTRPMPVLLLQRHPVVPEDPACS